MINAQSETCGTKAAFREAFRSRSCLVVANKFYEWPEKNKPRLITLKDNEPFAFAGVWDRWQPNGGEKLEAFSILTCPPNEFMADSCFEQALRATARSRNFGTPTWFSTRIA